mmetsp:Transcript_66423/g.187146  ORF Transcript_66423/g.187146 Transcript_66423/m.187146 type:complete len:339 (+) Transcript_66423:38-1054(+)
MGRAAPRGAAAAAAAGRAPPGGRRLAAPVRRAHGAPRRRPPADAARHPGHDDRDGPDPHDAGPDPPRGGVPPLRPPGRATHHSGTAGRGAAHDPPDPVAGRGQLVAHPPGVHERLQDGGHLRRRAAHVPVPLLPRQRPGVRAGRARGVRERGPRGLPGVHGGLHPEHRRRRPDGRPLPPVPRAGHAQGGPRPHRRRDPGEVRALPAAAAGPHGEGVPELRRAVQAHHRRGRGRSGGDDVRRLRLVVLLLPLERARGQVVRGVPAEDLEGGADPGEGPDAGDEGLPLLRHQDGEDRRVQPHDLRAVRGRLVLEVPEEAGRRDRALLAGGADRVPAVRRF